MIPVLPPSALVFVICPQNRLSKHPKASPCTWRKDTSPIIKSFSGWLWHFSNFSTWGGGVTEEDQEFEASLSYYVVRNIITRSW